MRNFNFEKTTVTPLEMLRASLYGYEKLLEDESMQLHGIVMVEDLSGMKFSDSMAMQKHFDKKTRALFFKLLQAPSHSSAR